MSRNSGGTYSLPAGNPVVTGTTISSTWANGTLSDISAEMTDSLSRSGKGGMLAHLRGIDGTAAAPALSFTSETGLGFYRSASGTLKVVSGATDMQTWTTALVTNHVPLSITGALTAAAGATITQSTTNGAGLVVTGNGTGNGLTSTGGATNGIAGRFFGVGTGQGVYSTSATGQAIYAESLSGSNPGAQVVGGPTAGTGLRAFGGAAGLGIHATNGTAATGAVRQNAALLSNGDLSFVGTANPNSDVAHTNVQGPANIVKAWVSVNLNNTVSPTITDGFNITSITIDGSGHLVVTLAGDFANATYVAVPIADSGTNRPYVVSKATGTTTFGMSNSFTPASDVDMSTLGDQVDIIWVGRQ